MILLLDRKVYQGLTQTMAQVPTNCSAGGNRVQIL